LYKEKYGNQYFFHNRLIITATEAATKKAFFKYHEKDLVMRSKDIASSRISYFEISTHRENTQTVHLKEKRCFHPWR
jgi:hypothetical protein